jgi:hypothetical protein
MLGRPDFLRRKHLIAGAGIAAAIVLLILLAEDASANRIHGLCRRGDLVVYESRQQWPEATAASAISAWQPYTSSPVRGSRP